MDPLEIKLELDKSQAEKESQAFHAGEKQRAADAKHAAWRAEDEKTAAIIAEIRKRQEASKQSHAAELARIKEQESAQRLAGAATAASFIALGTSAVGAIDQITRAWDRNRLATEEATRATVKHQAELLKAAYASGGGTPGQMADVSQTMAATGLGFADAAALKTEAQTGARGFASADELKTAMERAGRLGLISGQSGDSMGRAIGLLGETGGGNLAADEAESRLLQADKFARLGRFGGADAFLDQMRQSRDLVSGGRLSESEAGGLLALFGARGGGAEEVKALAEATEGDKRGIVGAALGWSDQIAEAKKAAAARGEGFSATDWLKAQGMEGGGATALAEFAEARGRWDKDIAPVLNAAPQAGTIDKQFDAMKNDPAVRAARAGSAAELSEIVAGQKGGVAESLRRQAFAELRASGKAEGDYGDYKDKRSAAAYLNPMTWIGLNGPSRGDLDAMMIARLREQAGSAGLDVRPGGEAWKLLNLAGGWDEQGKARSIFDGSGQNAADDAIAQLVKLIEARGVGTGADMDRFARAVDQFARAQAAPPPLQGAPRQPAAAPR